MVSLVRYLPFAAGVAEAERRGKGRMDVSFRELTVVWVTQQLVYLFYMHACYTAVSCGGY